jgi:hypothetical protein
MNKNIENIIEMYSEDEYMELCRIADCYGMEALKEEEQLIVMYYKQF